MADSATTQESVTWLMGLTGAGGGLGGLVLGLAGNRLYLRFLGGNSNSDRRGKMASLVAEMQTHHEKEIAMLGEINGSIRELTAYMKGAMTR